MCDFSENGGSIHWPCAEALLASTLALQRVALLRRESAERSGGTAGVQMLRTVSPHLQAGGAAPCLLLLGLNPVSADPDPATLGREGDECQAASVC